MNTNTGNASKYFILKWNIFLWISLFLVMTLLLIFSDVHFSFSKPISAITHHGLENEYYNFSITSYKETEILKPSHLLFFCAFKKDSEVRISWGIQGATESYLFEIERSINGRDYKTIGSVEVKATLAITEYSFVDQQPLIYNISYYRLKQIDIKGNFKYSYLRGVYPDDIEKLTMKVFPLPVADSVNVSFYCPAVEKVNAIICNKDGMVSLQKSFQMEQGQQQIKLSTKELSLGTYYFKLVGGETLYVSSFDVVR